MTQTPQKPRRILRIALVVSLTLNVVFVGAAVGFATKFGRPPEGPPTAANGSVYLRALSRESRRELGREMRELRTAHGARHGRTKANNYGYDRALAVLTQSPFDADQLAIIMQEQAKVSDDHLSEARRLLLEHLSQMTDAERQAYADEIQEILARRKR